MSVMNSVKTLTQRLQYLKTKRIGLALGLTGTPGIGKSYTAREAIQGSKLAYLKINANISNPSLAKVWLEFLDERNKRRLPQWVLVLLEHLRCNETVPLEGVVQLCITIMNQFAPFVLLIEDAHEATQAQLERWLLLARAIPKGLGVLLTSRNALPETFQQFIPEPLTEPETKVLLEQEAGIELPTAFITWIFARTQGNPLFSLEYLRDLRRRNALVWHGSDWQPPKREQLPNTVEAMLEYVLEGIKDPVLHKALEARALLGQDEAALWGVAANITNLEQVKHDLEQLGVLRGDDFSHPLFREVVIKHISRESQKIISQRLFEHLEHSNPIRAVSYVQDADIDTSRAFKIFQNAIETETDTSRCGLLQAKAFDFCPPKQRFEFAFKAAMAVSDVDLSEAARLIDIALRLDPGHLEANNVRARIWVMQGEIEKGRTLLESVSDNSTRWWLHWCGFLMLTRNTKAAWQVYNDHPEIQPLQKIQSKCQFAAYMIAQGWTNQAQQFLDSLFLQENLSFADQATILSTQSYLAGAQNQYQLAVELSDSACKVFANSTNSSRSITGITLLVNRANAYQLVNNLVSAQTDLEKALQLWRITGRISSMAATQMWLGNTLIERGLFSQAEDALLEARSLLNLHRVKQYTVSCEYFLAKLYFIWQPSNGNILALKHARLAVKLARLGATNQYILDAAFWLVLCELEFGHQEVIPELLLEIKEATSNFNIYNWHWLTGLYLAYQGKHKEAKHHLHQAIQQVAPDSSDSLWLQLELSRINYDLLSAKNILEHFRQQGYMLGVTLALRYFPELEATPQPQPSTLHINALGSLQVVLDGVTTSVRGTKRKYLAALLLEAQLGGRDECTHNDLADALYPNANEAEARASVRQLVFQWRTQFGINSIITTANGYAFQNVSSDAQQFLETGETALWRGAFLEDVTEWNIGILETVREALYTKLVQSANALVPNAALEASRLAKILLKAEPFDGAVLAVALRALKAQGSYKSISRMYKQSKETWLEVGERLPEHWTEFLKTTQA